MQIVIVNAFERGNRGDAALLSVTIQQIRQAFPQADVSIAGFERPAARPTFDGAPNIGSIRRYVGDEGVGRVTRMSRKAVAAVIAAIAAVPGCARLLPVLARILPREMRDEIVALAQADLVVSLGGGYLNARADIASDLNIALLLLPLWLAQRFGVPVVLGPQSYGPFPRGRQRAMVRRVVGKSAWAMAREAISESRLDDAGVPGDRVVRGVDSAFAVQSRSERAWREELRIPGDATLVLVTARRFLAAREQAVFEAAMASAVRHMLSWRNCHVVLVPQVTCAFQDDDDRIVNARISAALHSTRLHTLDDDRVDHHDIFALYACADLIVGTRFHSVIFGLVARVPCIAIEYDHKTRGIMQDLGLDQWVVRMSDVRPESIIRLIDTLAAEPHSYRRHLAAVLPSYSARTLEFVELMRQTIGDRSGGAASTGRWPKPEAAPSR